MPSCAPTAAAGPPLLMVGGLCNCAALTFVHGEESRSPSADGLRYLATSSVGRQRNTAYGATKATLPPGFKSVSEPPVIGLAERNTQGSFSAPMCIPESRPASLMATCRSPLSP